MLTFTYQHVHPFQHCFPCTEISTNQHNQLFIFLYCLPAVVSVLEEKVPDLAHCAIMCQPLPITLVPNIITFFL